MFSIKTDTARPSLARTLVEAIRTWWRQDDIRVSPNEGRLLRLDVPCIVEVEGELFEITRRAIGRRGDVNFVTYQGQAALGDTECQFECHPGSRHIGWSDARGTRSLDERAISVFSPKDRPMVVSGDIDTLE